MTKTLVLTSHKNFEWKSMQEIIPFIETAWEKASGSDHQVEIINIDESSVLKNIKKVMQVDNLVLTSFTIELALGVTALRAKFNLDFKLFFYVHGMASIGYWPLMKYGIGKVLNQNDTFVVTCDGDEKLTRSIFPKLNIIKHSFLNFREQKIKTKDSIEELVYIGRISEQKNIHLLVCAINEIKDELRSKNIKLRLFGGEDFLGSPNMGKKSTGYLLHLEKIVKDFKIEDLVIFEGHVNRSVLDEYLLKTNILYIAPSLHSDENFGMSPYNILKKGGRCLLTDWGGFSEFKPWFEDQVSYINIYKSRFGPTLDILEISQKISEELSKIVKTTEKDFNSYYSYKGIAKILNTEALKQNEGLPVLAEVTKLMEVLLEKREKFLVKDLHTRRNHGARIFDNYADENAQIFLNGYAKNILESRKRVEAKKNEMVPWVDVKSKFIYVNDFRLGEICFERNKSEEKKIKVRLKTKSEYLTENEYKELFELGLIV